MNRAQAIRSKKRKPVDTPDGPFLLRKIQPVDYIAASVALPEPITFGMDQAAIDRIVVEAQKNHDDMYMMTQRLLERVTVMTDECPKVIAECNEIDESKNEISISDLEHETINILITTMNSFTGVGDVPKSGRAVKGGSPTRKH